MDREFELIARIRRLTESKERAPEDGVLGIGDDCAVLPMGDRDVLLTKDLLVEDVHFSFLTHTPEEIGKKSIYVNVSDIFAMKGRPEYVLTGLAAPKGTSQERMEGLLSGLLSAADEFGLRLIGGDTVATKDKMVLSITLVGSCEKGRAVLRSGAKAGDLIGVTGCLGESAGGLIALTKGISGYESLKRRHKLPRPARISESIARAVTAMIDLSDGLSGDLLHICEESGVGARVFAEKIPVSEELTDFCRQEGLSPLELALHGGEDFYNLFCLSRREGDSIVRTSERISAIGEIIPREEAERLGGRILLNVEGKDSPLKIKSWDHFS